MIQLFIGDNNFAIDRAVAQIVARFDGTVEQYEGDILTPEMLVDITSGTTLFSAQRCVIIKRLSDNKALWSNAVAWLERVGDTTQLILIEPQLDKRTKTAKWLQKNGAVETFPAWGEQDTARAAQWLAEEATQQGITIDRDIIVRIVERVGVDQWQLYHALEKVALLDEVTVATVEEIIEPSTHENVFNLFETALQGDRAKVRQMLERLKKTEDPYRVFGLLASQVFQLAALVATTRSVREVASEINAHPFALQKLAPYKSQYGRQGANALVTAFARADRRMKTTDTKPWVLIEQALFSVEQPHK